MARALHFIEKIRVPIQLDLSGSKCCHLRRLGIKISKIHTHWGIYIGMYSQSQWFLPGIGHSSAKVFTFLLTYPEVWWDQFGATLTQVLAKTLKYNPKCSYLHWLVLDYGFYKTNWSLARILGWQRARASSWSNGCPSTAISMPNPSNGFHVKTPQKGPDCCPARETTAVNSPRKCWLAQAGDGMTGADSIASV